jgi:hypothetical protein
MQQVVFDISNTKFDISQRIRYSRSLWLLSGLPVEDIALLFGINMAGDKVKMAPIISPRSLVMKIMY